MMNGGQGHHDRLDHDPDNGPAPLRGLRGPRFSMQFKVNIRASPSSPRGQRPKIHHPHQYKGAEVGSGPRESGMMPSPRAPQTSFAHHQQPRQELGTILVGPPGGNHSSNVVHTLPFSGRSDSLDQTPTIMASPSPVTPSRRRFSLTTLVRTPKSTATSKPGAPKTPQSPLPSFHLPTSVKDNLKKRWRSLHLLPTNPRESTDQTQKQGHSPQQRLSTTSSRFVEDLRSRRISSPFVGTRMAGMRGEGTAWRSSFDGDTMGMNEVGLGPKRRSAPSTHNPRHSFQAPSNTSTPLTQSISNYPPRHSIDLGHRPNPALANCNTSLSPHLHSRPLAPTPYPTPYNPNFNANTIKRKPPPPLTPSMIRKAGGTSDKEVSGVGKALPLASGGMNKVTSRNVSVPGASSSSLSSKVDVLRRPVLQEIQPLTLRSSTSAEGGRRDEAGAEV
ncbi:BQ2448_7637 [Microbotryum intermedium]|uniref:BQ2448_7637 protein n=1 Tax=Microbotryum intermedium TaxID=269621 RepID=A0A238FTQ5_9BASI|nr:BQ2448_7637 [Microbotryum intermedium]